MNILDLAEFLVCLCHYVMLYISINQRSCPGKIVVITMIQIWFTIANYVYDLNTLYMRFRWKMQTATKFLNLPERALVKQVLSILLLNAVSRCVKKCFRYHVNGIQMNVGWCNIMFNVASLHAVINAWDEWLWLHIFLFMVESVFLVLWRW